MRMLGTTPCKGVFRGFPTGRIGAIAILALLLSLPAAWARQDDPRLDGLFERLRQAEGAHAAGAIEQRIWAIWLESGDGDLDAAMARGRAAMHRQDYLQALNAFDQVVQRAPDFAEGWNKRATLFYLMGEYAESVRDIERTLALEPRHFGALSGLGLIYLAIDDEAAALRAFEASLAIHPQSAGTRAEVERLRARRRGKAI